MYTHSSCSDDLDVLREPAYGQSRILAIEELLNKTERPLSPDFSGGLTLIRARRDSVVAVQAGLLDFE
jgi:hypothetical protein